MLPSSSAQKIPDTKMSILDFAPNRLPEPQAHPGYGKMGSLGPFRHGEPGRSSNRFESGRNTMGHYLSPRGGHALSTKGQGVPAGMPPIRIQGRPIEPDRCPECLMRSPISSWNRIYSITDPTRLCTHFSITEISSAFKGGELAGILLPEMPSLPFIFMRR